VTRRLLICHLQRARELVYRLLLAADHADVRIAALTTDGSPEMPAFLIAITKGEEAAVPSDKLSPGSSAGQMRPMTNVPRI
jgi:hypothetical protein